MDQLLHLGKVYLSVKADGRVFTAIQTDEPLFDAGRGRADQMKERFAGQLRDFTDLLDAMRGGSTCHFGEPLCCSSWRQPGFS